LLGIQRCRRIKRPPAGVCAYQRLQQLKLHAYVSTSSQLWVQLASMPALRSLELHRLCVDSVAAPSASIRRLAATLHLRQLPAEQLDGCLAVLLPGLEQLERKLGECTAIETMSAVRSHPMLQQLSLSGIDRRAAQPWMGPAADPAQHA
jgi:hypothetical protein